MFYEKFERLCRQKGVKPGKACTDMGLSRSLSAKWKNMGTKKPSADVLEKMSAYFGISIDEILSDDLHFYSEDIKKSPALTKKDERDIAKTLANLKETLENEEGLMFDGDPMSDEAKESILAAMELGLQAAKLKNKEKYTPKKYKKD